MSLQFYLGGSGSGKSTRLQQDIIEWSMRDAGKQFIVLVPDQFTMQTQKEMVERHPAKGIMNIDVLSFGRLSYRIFEEVGRRERIVLDDTGKNLILRKIAGDLENMLPVLGSSLKKTGYIHEIKSVISEFMQYGLGEKELNTLIEYCASKPALSGKLKDLQKIYEKFLEYLGEKYITTEETMEILAQALPSSDWIKGSVVVFDGFTGFTPVQNRVIEQIMVLAEEVLVAVTVEEEALKKSEQDMQLFSLSIKTIRSLEKIAKENQVSRKPDVWFLEKPVARFANRPMLAHLEHHIFRYPLKAYEQEEFSENISEKNSQQNEEIALFVADSPREELRHVCRKIRNLVEERGYAYRDIAVITGDLERYSPYAEELFDLYQIPAFVDANRKLVLNPFTEYIKSGLLVVSRGFSYDSVMHFLRSGLTGIPQEEIDALENYILALGIRGQKKWERMFVRYPEYMKNDMEALERINTTRETVMELLKDILPLKKGGDAEKLALAVYHFVARQGVYDKLMKFRSYFKEIGDFSREKEYSQIYRYFMELLEQISSLLMGEEVTLEEFIQILEAGISEISVGILPQEVDYVVLGDMERTRLQGIKALFFVGVNDGVVPGSGAGGGMISDMDREFLRESGFELSPSPRQKMYIQRMYLYMNMTKPTEYLSISYGKMDGEGKSIRPSYLIDTMKQLFPGLKVEDAGKTAAIDKIVGEKDGIMFLADLLREYVQSTLPETEQELFFALYDEYRTIRKQDTKKLTDAAFYRYQTKSLPREISRMLYGMVLENSISRVEQFARCAYAHFLNYGMELKEREDFVFGSLDMGNVFHQVLERFGRELRERHLSWNEVTEPEAEMLLKESLLAVSAEYGESILFQNARTAYQIKRLERILLRAVKNIQYQLRKGKFLPKNLEVNFRREIDPGKWKIGLEEEEKNYIRGKIDRVDAFEEDGTVYVKVVDYKSGDKKIDLVELYYGLQLQLVVYLDQAVKKEQGKNPEKEVKPAALFYYPVVDPLMEQEKKEGPEEVMRWLHKRLRMSGLIVDEEEVVSGLDGNFTDASDVVALERKKDGSWKANSDVVTREDLEIITSYVDRKIAEIGMQMRNGEKTAAPCGDKVCSYCSYKEICNFDGAIPGYQKKTVEKMSRQEVLEKMKKTITE